MDYQPVGSNSDTIVASAEFTAESAVLFMELIEQKKEARIRLQERRETAFFDRDSAAGVTFEDVETSDLKLQDRQLEEIESRNSGTWSQIIEDCYRYSEHREPEHPLTRVESVSENASRTGTDDSMNFKIENMEVKEQDGEEMVNISVDSENTISLFIDSENMELYKGMYDPPLTFDIDSIAEYADCFTEVSVRNISRAGRELFNSMKPENVNREVTKTEVILKNPNSVLEYIPQEVLDNTKSEEPSQLTKDIQEMESLIPLPNEETKKKLFETLERGYLTSEESLKLFELIDGKERGAVSFSYLAHKNYLEQVAQLLDKNIIAVPQTQQLLFTSEEPPEWIRELNQSFPEKNSLSKREQKKLAEYLDYPEFMDMTNEWRQDLQAKEILLEMFEDQEIEQDHIVSYYLLPWERIRPEKEHVKSAIKYGENLRERLKQVDDKYGTELYNSTVVWEQRKIYRRSEFEV